MRALLLRGMLNETVGADQELFASLLGKMAARYGIEQHKLLRLIQPGTVSAAHADAITAILLSLRDEAVGEAPRSDSTAGAANRPLRDIPHFARAAREFVVRGWFEERGSYFNRRSFIKSLLQQLAARHGIAYQDLLLGLIEQTMPVMRTRVQPTALPGILWSLKDELAPDEKTTTRSALSTPAAPALPLNLHFLEHGVVDATANPAHWQRLLTHGLWFGNGERFIAALRKMKRRDQLIERLLDYLPEARLIRLLMLFSPSYGGFIHTYLLAAGGLEHLPQLSHGQRTQAARMHWRAVLRFLLDPRNRDFTLPRFLAACSELAQQWLKLPEPLYNACLQAVTAQRASTAARYRPLLDLLHRQATGSGDAILPPEPAPPDAASPAIGTGNTADESAGDIALARLARWLKYGSAAGSTAVIQTLLAQALAEQPGALRTLLLRHAAHALDRARIVSLLAPSLREKILQLLLAQDYSDLLQWRALLAATLAAVDTGSMARRWETLLADASLALLGSGRGARVRPAELLEHFMFRLTREYRFDIERVIRQLEQEVVRLPAAQAILADSVQTLKRRLRDDGGKEADDSSTKRPETGEKFQIGNAGLVLLYPFLEQYFGTLGMLKDKQFIDFGHQCRAVHLLQYLCTGSIEAAEHDLLLNKILCGMESNAVLEVAGPISKEEQELSEQLLYSVTQLWEKLKNTSVDGLRTTFLMREGLLLRNEQDWTLTVATMQFDVLLASLPWSVATICLSWMESPLWVRWK